MKHYEFMHEITQTASIFGRNSNVNIQFEGNEVKTVGNTIHLPNLPINADLTRDTVQRLRGYVDKEAGHIRHSHTGRLAEFYDRCNNNGNEELGKIQSVVEDLWVENKVQDEYIGSTKNLHSSNEHRSKEFNKVISKSGYKFPEKGISPQDVYLGMATLGRKEYSGSETREIYDSIPESVLPHIQNWSDKAKECSSTEEAIRLAKAIYEYLKKDPNLDQPPDEFQGDEGDELSEGENSEEYNAKNKGEKGSPDKGGNEGEGSGPQNKDGTKPDPSNLNQGKDGEGVDGQHIDFQQVGDNSSPSDPANNSSGGSTGWYESNIRKPYTVGSTARDIKYRRGKEIPSYASRGVQSIIDSTDPSHYNKVMSNIQGNVNVMKTKLRRALLAKQNRDWDFGREHGKLDSKRLVSAYQGNRNVHKVRKEREEADTAITLLVDLSGSMYGNKAKVARDCVLSIAECLAGSNYNFSVVGFCNKGSAKSKDYATRIERLDEIYFKSFGDPYRIAKFSVAQLNSCVGGNNSDYDFIMSAIQGLKEREEKRKVLITLSDGYPAQAGKSSDLLWHCRNAVGYGAKQGVECVGIGILSDAVERIYPNHVVVNNVNELSGASFNKLTEILL